MLIELRGPRKGLINIRNNDQKCFLWCHVRHINPSKEHTGEIKRVDKRLANNLDYDEIEFPVKEKDFNKIEAQNHVPCSFAYKIVCIDDKFSKPIVVYRRENAAYEFIKAILKEYKYCKKIMKKHFNKNLIMNEEEEYLFQQSNSCSICEKLIDNDDEKVRDHCHVTGRFRGATHRSCNINFQLTKRIPVIFHNLRGYNSHLIFSELNKLNVKIDVIPNGSEKMAFFLNKNLAFIDCMQFMNSSLDKLDKNLSDEDFEYLVEEFGSEYLEILKQKGAYP